MYYHQHSAASFGAFAPSSDRIIHVLYYIVCILLVYSR